MTEITKKCVDNLGHYYLDSYCSGAGKIQYDSATGYCICVCDENFTGLRCESTTFGNFFKSHAEQDLIPTLRNFINENVEKHDHEIKILRVFLICICGIGVDVGGFLA